MITVTILAKNSERRLKEVLDALKEFPEIILLDTGSTDRTVSIASQYSNVKIFHAPFKGFGASHNLATSYASYDWILSIDSDEILSSELAKEILTKKLSRGKVYDIPFKNYFNGRWIRWCGWYPESHVRLYHRLDTSFSEAHVHEGVIFKNLHIEKLKNHVHHYPYESIHDFLDKMQRYSELFAEQYATKRSSSPFTAFIHGFTAFIKSFFLKKGFMGGYEGFIISAYNGHTAFYKYLKLYEKNKRLSCSSR